MSVKPLIRSLMGAAAVIAISACAPGPFSGPATRSVASFADPGLPAPITRTLPAAPQLRPPLASNADIARDFIDLSFRLESGRILPRLTRFEGPISVRVTGQPPATLTNDLGKLVRRLQTEARVPIAISTNPRANITVEAVPRAQIRATLPTAACFVVPNVRSLAEYRTLRRSARTSWAQVVERQHLSIFVPSDAAPQEVRDCLHEELAQALGPLNDLYRLSDSVFNDDNVHTVLTSYDMLILRTYYHPSLKSGMSREEVTRRLPGLLAQLNPAGQSRPRQALGSTPRDWVTSVQTALGPGASGSVRKQAARHAVDIAQSIGWTDHRRGFSHYAYGRILHASDPRAARQQFELAARYWGARPDTALHAAYAASQLATIAVSDRRAPEALALIEPHLATARAHENAALMATLLMLKAEALRQTGQRAESARVRVDSQDWARYGFGSDWAVRARSQQIASR